jgi:hypothetical protein
MFVLLNEAPTNRDVYLFAEIDIVTRLGSITIIWILSKVVKFKSEIIYQVARV